MGTACDGDSNRKIIFGLRMLVSPSDSLAAITHNADLINGLARNGPLKGVARSMPISGTVDRVAKKNVHILTKFWFEIFLYFIRFHYVVKNHMVLKVINKKIVFGLFYVCHQF